MWGKNKENRDHGCFGLDNLIPQLSGHSSLGSRMVYGASCNLPWVPMCLCFTRTTKQHVVGSGDAELYSDGSCPGGTWQSPPWTQVYSSPVLELDLHSHLA